MSNDLPTSLTRLRGELERAIKRELEPAPAATRARRARPPVLAGATLGIAAGVTALVLVFTAGSSPAYAVTRNHDGTISVKITRLQAVPLANARLARMKLPVRLVQVANGCRIRPPLVSAPRPLQRPAPQVLIRPWRIPSGRTLVLGVAKDGRRIHVAAPVAVAAGGLPCLPPIAPPCARWTKRLSGPPPKVVIGPPPPWLVAPRGDARVQRRIICPHH